MTNIPSMSTVTLCAGDTLPSTLITALFEVLSFPALMDSLKVNQALEAALLHLKQSHELALTDGGRYQGLYRLMAHPSPQIRAMVSCTQQTPPPAPPFPQAFAYLQVVSILHNVMIFP